MVGRFHPKTTPKENFLALWRMIPWRMYLVSILLITIALPTFVYGIYIGKNVFFNAAHFFYTLSTLPVASPTPQPALPMLLPQAGSIFYTVEDGDSCDSVLAYQKAFPAALKLRFHENYPRVYAHLLHDYADALDKAGAPPNRSKEVRKNAGPKKSEPLEQEIQYYPPRKAEPVTQTQATGHPGR